MRLTAKKAFEQLTQSSWDYSFFEFTDDFRASAYDLSLILDEPEKLSDLKEGALLRSIVYYLCLEGKIPEENIPIWAVQRQWLFDPWYVSGIQNLYAMALVESPLSYRNNNIFVLSNFLNRA
jgi:hypothetical protein